MEQIRQNKKIEPNKQTEHSKKKQYSKKKDLIFLECSHLKYENLEIGGVYSYKQICSLIGATYLGTYRNGIQMQKEFWKEYIDFEETDGKMKINGIKETREDYNNDKGGGRDNISGDIKDWLVGTDVDVSKPSGVGESNGLNGLSGPASFGVSVTKNRDLDDKERFIRNELGKSKYYGTMCDALMLNILESLRSDGRERERGRIEKQNGEEWVFLEKSYMKWRTGVGLISEQFRKYYNRLSESYTGSIASETIIKVTSDVFRRLIDKLKKETSFFKIIKGAEVLFIDRDKRIFRKDGFVGGAVPFNGRYYKFGIESVDNKLQLLLDICKEEAIKEFGQNFGRDNFTMEDLNKMSPGVKRAFNQFLREKLPSVPFKSECVSEYEKQVNEDGEVVPAPRYTIVNCWDTLAIGIRLSTLINYVKDIKIKMDKEAGFSSSYDGELSNTDKAGKALLLEQQYLDKMRDRVNQVAVDRVIGRLDRTKQKSRRRSDGTDFVDSVNGGDSKNKNVGKNISKNIEDQISFYDDYDNKTINSSSGKIATELFEIKENNNFLFDSDEWRLRGVVPVLNKDDEIVGGLEEEEDGTIRIHGFKNGLDISGSSIDDVVNSDDEVEGLSDEEALEKIKERQSQTSKLSNDIWDMYIDVMKGLITVFGRRGDNNYNIAGNMRFAKKEDVEDTFREIKREIKQSHQDCGRKPNKLDI